MTVKLNRAGAAAGVLAAALALAACGSSGGGKSSAPAPKSSGPTTSTSTSGSAAATSDVSCATGTLSANGSSAQANAMTTFATAYQKKCSGATINYTSTNSGQGVSDFIAGKIGFGGSDSALNPAAQEPAKATKACGSTALDIPMVTGPIAIGYKVKGVSSLTLTPSVLAQIFFGKITNWDNTKIAAINKGVKLPSEPIKVFFRSDPSGTSKNFETYLKAAAPSDFPYTPDKPWPGKVGQGVQGSPAVASGVKATEGGIGYMEWSYAGNNNLTPAKIDNGGGAVTLNGASAGKTVQTAKVVGTGDDLSLSIDYATKAAGAYPIVLVTYEIVCSKYKVPATGKLVKSFLTFTASNAEQATLPAQGYAPLPAAVLTKVQAAVAKIS